MMLLAGLTLACLGVLGVIGCAAYADHRRSVGDLLFQHCGADDEFATFLALWNQQDAFASYDEPLAPEQHWSTRPGVLEVSEAGWPA